MSTNNLPLSIILLCVTLVSQLIIAPSSLTQTISMADIQVWQTFTPPKNGTPDSTASGATRGECPGDNLPENKRFSSMLPSYSETKADRPSFIVYIPKTIAKKVFFSLRDANENYFYERELSLPQTSGTYRLQLPADAPAIALGKQYEWSLSLVCGQTVDPNDPRVGGVIDF